MSDSYSTFGEVVSVGETEERGAKKFKVRSLVIEQTSGKFPIELYFEAVQDQVKILDGLREGQTVEVSFNIKSREYNGRWYTNMQAWKVVTHSTSNPEPQPAMASGGADGELPNPPDEEDDCPF